MKHLIFMSFISFVGCASFPDKGAIITLASFDLKCLPEEIETSKIDEDYVEARCDDRSVRYFRKCFKDNKCIWIRVKGSANQ